MRFINATWQRCGSSHENEIYHGRLVGRWCLERHASQTASANGRKEKAIHRLPGGLSGSTFTKDEGEASNFAAEEDLQWYRNAKVGMLLQFGLSTHENLEVSWGDCHTRKAPDVGNGPIPDETWQSWAKEFKFEKFDAKQWVEIAQKPCSSISWPSEAP